jgi:methylated-DNA-[protein]-cysteine S-methyltransferase
MVTLIQKTKTLYWSSVPSPRGTCVVMATEDGVCWAGTPATPVDDGLVWARRNLPVKQILNSARITPLQQALDELRRYFTGERMQFSCPLDLHGTAFQLEVWHELTRIPYGETRSYAEIARAIARPAASRAVGAANGANPVAIIVPCHRVIGSDGTLTGYGGGLPTKQWLLELEGGLGMH